MKASTLLALSTLMALAVVTAAGNPCEGNRDDSGNLRFKCLGQSRYAMCVGEYLAAKTSCSEGTDCQCEGFNKFNPCGSGTSIALCLNSDTRELCEENEDDEHAFVCESEDIYVACYGQRSVDRKQVPPGTKCQCEGLTSSPPWGTDSSRSKCRRV